MTEKKTSHPKKLSVTIYKIAFVNYKYNVLLKRNDVCLMPLSTFVTLSRFDEGKEIRIVRSKMA